MMQRFLATGLLALACAPAVHAQVDIAPRATLRAAYLATNPAQANRNAQTGEMRGVSYNLAQRLSAHRQRVAERAAVRKAIAAELAQ